MDINIEYLKSSGYTPKPITKDICIWESCDGLVTLFKYSDNNTWVVHVDSDRRETIGSLIVSDTSTLETFLKLAGRK